MDIEAGLAAFVGIWAIAWLIVIRNLRRGRMYRRRRFTYLALRATWSPEEPWVLRLGLEAVPRMDVTVKEVRWTAYVWEKGDHFSPEDSGGRVPIGTATKAIDKPWIWGRRMWLTTEFPVWDEATFASAELRLAGDARVIKVGSPVRPGPAPYRKPPFAKPTPPFARPEPEFEALPHDVQQAIHLTEQRYRDLQL